MPEPTIINARKPSLWWNQPWTLVEGCTPCSDGCRDCWSASVYHRFHRSRDIKAGRAPLTDDKGRWTGRIRLRWDRLDRPAARHKPAVCALWNDIFHPAVETSVIDRAWAMMGLSPWHTFIVLTKRAKRMATYVPDLIRRAEDGEWTIGPLHEPLPNVILGVTCESNDYLWRIEELVKTPAAVRFVNAHLLGPLDISPLLECRACRVIHGRDTGPAAINTIGGTFHWCGRGECCPLIHWLAIECNRPFRGDPAEWWGWCRSLIEQATAAGVPVWVKQGPLPSGKVTHDLRGLPRMGAPPREPRN